LRGVNCPNKRDLKGLTPLSLFVLVLLERPVGPFLFWPSGAQSAKRKVIVIPDQLALLFEQVNKKNIFEINQIQGSVNILSRIIWGVN